jgi:hypothetical protein
VLLSTRFNYNNNYKYYALIYPVFAQFIDHSLSGRA